MMKSNLGVRINANFEAIGLELCKPDIHAPFHTLDHRLDSETRIE